MPRSPSTRSRSPVRMAMVAPGTLTTAGMPYSRATTAACESGPPSSVTTAAATRKSGESPTSVVRETRISPACDRVEAHGAGLEHAGEALDHAAARRQPREARARRGRQDERRRAPDEGGRRIGPRRVARVLGAAQAHDVADLGAAAAEGGDELVVGAEEDAARGQRGIDAAEPAVDVERDGADHPEHAGDPGAHPLAQAGEALRARHEEADEARAPPPRPASRAAPSRDRRARAPGRAPGRDRRRGARSAETSMAMTCAGSSRQRGVASSASRTARSP